jgi:hypothetical protein
MFTESRNVNYKVGMSKRKKQRSTYTQRTKQGNFYCLDDNNNNNNDNAISTIMPTILAIQIRFRLQQRVCYFLKSVGINEVSVLCDVTLQCLEGHHHYIGGKCCLHLQDVLKFEVKYW